MPLRPRLLRAGDLVRFDGRLHTVAALEGAAVRLVDEKQSASVVMLAHLLSGEDFEVLSATSARTVMPAADVLEGLPGKAVERAGWWQRHLVEMLTGRPWDGPDGPVLSEYDPAVRSLRQRELAKAAELAAAGTAVSMTVLQDMRARFEREGVLCASASPSASREDEAANSVVIVAVRMPTFGPSRASGQISPGTHPSVLCCTSVVGRVPAGRVTVTDIKTALHRQALRRPPGGGEPTSTGHGARSGIG